MPAALHLRIATSDLDVLKAHVIRGIVFIEEQEVDWEGEIDAFEAEAIHILGEADGQPVACARLREVDGGVMKLERIAVRRRWRGRGYGRQVVEFMLAHARTLGAKRFKMHAQSHLEDFYAQLGFTREGDNFDECGIDHVTMVRDES